MLFSGSGINDQSQEVSKFYCLFGHLFWDASVFCEGNELNLIATFFK